MLKADFHMHFGKESHHDSGYSAEQLIDHCKAVGYEVMALTLHDKVGATKDIIAYAKKKGILLISGIEATIEGAHVIVLNVSKDEGERLETFDDIRKLKKKRNIVVIAPHPYFPSKEALKDRLVKNIDVFDAIEYSHFYTYLVNFNRKAMKAAVKYKKPIVGTSDCHRLYQVGYTYTMLDCKKNISAVLDAIRKSKGGIVSRPFPVWNIIKVLCWMFF
jgi:predicted metal-dependent phosphoesterase TrpH